MDPESELVAVRAAEHGTGITFTGHVVAQHDPGDGVWLDEIGERGVEDARDIEPIWMLDVERIRPERVSDRHANRLEFAAERHTGLVVELASQADDRLLLHQHVLEGLADSSVDDDDRSIHPEGDTGRHLRWTATAAALPNVERDGPAHIEVRDVELDRCGEFV